MKKAALLLLGAVSAISIAQAKPGPERIIAQVTEVRGPQTLRTMITLEDTGRRSGSGIGQWTTSVRCEAHNSTTGETTNISSTGGVEYFQGWFSLHTKSLGEISLMIPADDFRDGKGGKGELSTGDKRCASGVPTVKQANAEQKPEAAPLPKGVVELTGRPWSHNGSSVFADPETGIIAYDEPKASIRSVVKHGTVLFRGSLREGKVQGTAYAFKEGCPPAPYPVRGAYSDHMYKLTLRGAGPIRSGCDVTGYSDRSPHSNLVFSYVLND